jgi:hypothetical protein
MASPFKEYQGGIQAIPNAYQMMTAPTSIIAQSALAGLDKYMKGKEEGEQQAAAIAEKREDRALKAQELNRKYVKDQADRNTKMYELKLNEGKIELDTIKDEQDSTRAELADLQAQAMLFKQTSGRGRTQHEIGEMPEYKSLVERITQLNADIADQNSRRKDVLSRNRVYNLAAQRAANAEPNVSPMDAGKAARFVTAAINQSLGNPIGQVMDAFGGTGNMADILRLGNQLSNFSNSQGGVQTNSVTQTPATGMSEPTPTMPTNRPDAGPRMQEPVDGGSVPAQPQEEPITATYPETGALVDSEGNPLKFSQTPPPESEESVMFRARHQGGLLRFNTVGANGLPPSAGDGIWQLGKQGFEIGKNFVVDPDAEIAAGVGEGWARVGGKREYKMTPSLSMTTEGTKTATDLYNKLKASGKLSAEWSLADFRDAYAVRAYLNNTGEVRPDAVAQHSAMWADLSRTNRGQTTDGNIPVPAAYVASDLRSPVSEYKPYTPENIPPFPEQDPYVIIPTKAGIPISNLVNSAINQRNEAATARWRAEVAAVQNRTEAAKAQAEGAKALAEGAKAENERLQIQSKEEIEAAKHVATSAQAMPGLTPNSTNRANGFVRYAVSPETRTAFDSIAKSSASSGRRQNPSNIDYSRAFMGIASAGVDPELAKKDVVGSRESWESFRKGFLASGILTAELERQVTEANQDFGVILGRVKNQFRPGTAAASNYRMFLLGAFRKSTVGLGNPSNFEQELLLSLIPDPKAIFEMKDSALARARMLMFYQAATMVREMDMHNMELTEQTEEQLTQMFRSAGVIRGSQRITKAAMEDLNTVLRDINDNPQIQVDRIMNWVTRNQYHIGAERQFDTLREELRTRWLRSGSTEHAKAREALVEEIGREPDPKTRTRLLEMVADSYK